MRIENFAIGGLQKSSLLDYPEKISAIIFTQGCNFRCSYCHNPELLSFEKEKMTTEECLKFLSTRIGKLDAVVITGGEPCLQKGLKDFILAVKKLGFLIKLDTNGSCSNVLAELLNENLLDYVAMDIKAPLEKYDKIIGFNTDTTQIERSVQLLLKSNIEYEFRTTVIKSQLSPQDFEEIGKLICGAKKYYLQKFIASKPYDKNLMNEKSYTDEEFVPIVILLQQKINFVEVR